MRDPVLDEVSGESRLVPWEGRRIGLRSRECSAARIAPVFAELRHSKRETFAEITQGR
jgi:hypothetical protein